MKIVETIHHGQYRNVRVFEDRPSKTGLLSFVRNCPYLASGASRQLVADQLHLIANSPAGKGSLDVGWVHWEVSA